MTSDPKLADLRGLFVISLGVAAAMGLFRLLAPETFQALDEGLLRAPRKPEAPEELRGPDGLVGRVRDLTALGSTVVLGCLWLCVCGWLVLKSEFTRLIWFASSVLASLGLMSGLKAIAQRPRPEVVPHLVVETTWSWPSGHSMMSTVVLLLCVRLDRSLGMPAVGSRYLGVVSLVWIGLVGASRVAMGVHYPSDVLSGWIIGLWMVCLCSKSLEGISPPLIKGHENS